MSDILARRCKTYFKLFDQNNDGFLSLKEYTDYGDRHSDTEKATDEDREKLKARFADAWRKWMKSAGSDDNGLLTPSIMVESVKQQKNDPAYTETFRLLCVAFFRLLDVNGDGFLQEDEYERAMTSIGVQGSGIVRTAFQTIDLNGDGKLSLEEFSIALTEYLSSDDENSRHNGLWGPLAD